MHNEVRPRNAADFVVRLRRSALMKSGNGSAAGGLPSQRKFAPRTSDRVSDEKFEKRRLLRKARKAEKINFAAAQNPQIQAVRYPYIRAWRTASFQELRNDARACIVTAYGVCLASEELVSPP